MEKCEEVNAKITAEVFSAYLKCPTKAYLLAKGDKPTDSFFTDIRRQLSTAFKNNYDHIRSVNFSDLASFQNNELKNIFVDSSTVFYDKKPCDYNKNTNYNASGSGIYKCIPVLYSEWNKLEPSDKILLSFGALSIARLLGTDSSPEGGIICGCKSFRTIAIDDNLQMTLSIIQSIEKLISAKKQPALIINKHCSVCDFQSRCHEAAVSDDIISLIGGMTEKEQAKCAEKGINSITHLSYGYRPRRQKRINSASARKNIAFKPNHQLKALAIKKAQIHVVGSPALQIEGTPVFIDIEGIPDRDFYYLIGLRYQKQGKYVERSFWADRFEDECRIWQDCLNDLRQIDNPTLVHYGAYENRFLRVMRNRYKPSDDDAAFVGHVVDGSLNLLAIIFAKIYFPTYSNGLKEIANWLGFKWTWSKASGGGALLLRRCWELTGDDKLRRELITYNIEDCRAAELVADAIRVICCNSESDSSKKMKTVDVNSLDVPFQRTFGKFPSALREFGIINAAAYWDYQRSKVYVRTDKCVRPTDDKSNKSVKQVSVERDEIVDDRPMFCPKCRGSKMWIAVRASHIVYDLKFTRRGIKRWTIRSHYNNYRCGDCKSQVTPYITDSKYGVNLRAYIAYLLIELRLSHEKISEHLATVFDIPIGHTMVNTIKHEMAEKYEPTYRGILKKIASEHLVHADETKGVVYNGGHYVWIFANLTSVAYVYSASRDSSILNEHLAGFDGVLVSDFYGGYDGVPCHQQKCLIHLMRDINEDILKYPFNVELISIAKRFGTLLRGIVETIDNYGLKKYHLKKHKVSVEEFFTDVAALHCSTEAGQALKKRIEKNRHKLFTFLDYDGVPWNNNNAEHAVRAFTRLRNVISTSTPKGTIDYCILLSLQQTLIYRRQTFLQFLRSGKIELNE